MHSELIQRAERPGRVFLSIVRALFVRLAVIFSGAAGLYPRLIAA